MVLSVGWITIQRISIRETNVVFHRVEIYPVDSVIRLLNNWGLVKSVRETALKCLSNPNRISERAMIGLLQNPLSSCWSGWREIRNAFPVIRQVRGRHRTRIAAPLRRRYYPQLDYVCNTGYLSPLLGIWWTHDWPAFQLAWITYKRPFIRSNDENEIF